jgi:hypothetical protein
MGEHGGLAKGKNPKVRIPVADGRNVQGIMT